MSAQVIQFTRWGTQHKIDAEDDRAYWTPETHDAEIVSLLSFTEQRAINEMRVAREMEMGR